MNLSQAASILLVLACVLVPQVLAAYFNALRISESEQ